AVTSVRSARTEAAVHFASPLREPVWQRCRAPGLIARGLSENRQQVKGIFATGLWPHCYVAEHRDFSSPPTRPVLHQRRNTDFPQARVRRRRIRGEAILLLIIIRAEGRTDALAWDHLRELLDASADAFKEYSNGRCSQGTSYAGFVAEHPRLLIASSTACFISASKYGLPTSSRASPHHSWVVVSLVIFKGFGGGSYKVHPVNANALISATSAGIAPA